MRHIDRVIGMYDRGGTAPNFPQPDHGMPPFFPVFDERFLSLDHPDIQAKRRPEVDENVRLHQIFDSDREDRESILAPLLKTHNKHNTVLVMYLNASYMDMFANWVRPCDDNGIDVRSWSVVFTTDHEAGRRLEGLGFATYADETSYGSQPTAASAQYGDDEFVRLMFLKAAIVQDILNLGYDVLFQDVDVVWKKDPSDYLFHRSRRSLDAQFMYDGPNQVYEPIHANCGFFLLRNTPVSKRFWTLVFDNYDKVIHYRSLQRVVNFVLVSQYFRGLKLDILPEKAFANGHLFDINGAANLPTEPYVIHCSWTANIQHKIEKYKKAGLWYL